MPDQLTGGERRLLARAVEEAKRAHDRLEYVKAHLAEEHDLSDHDELRPDGSIVRSGRNKERLEENFKEEIEEKRDE